MKCLILLLLFCSSVYAEFSASIGYDLSQGNTEKKSVAFSAGYFHIKEIHEIIVKGSTQYGESKKVKDVNKGRFTIKYDYNFIKTGSAFLFVYPVYNEFQNIKIRVQNGLGYKHIFYKHEFLEPSISLAILYEHTKFMDAALKDIGRWSLRPKLKAGISEDNYLNLTFFYQPRVDQFNDYRIYLIAAIEIHFFSNFYFEFKVVDEYNSIVQQDIEKNDLTIFNALKIRM